MEDCILKINLIVFITLTIFYLYQFIYVAVVLFKKHKRYIMRNDDRQRRYAADRGLARNQKEVHGRGDDPHCYRHDGGFF